MYKMLFILFLFYTQLFADNNDVFSFPIKDTEKIEYEMQIPSSISGNFVQEKRLSDIEITLRSRGVFSVSKNGSLNWNTIEPFSYSIVLSDRKIIIQNEEISSGATLENILHIIKMVLMRNYSELQKYFDLFYKKSDECFHFGMISKTSEISVFFSRLTASGKNHFETVTLFAANGDITTIVFSDIKEGSDEILAD